MLHRTISAMHNFCTFLFTYQLSIMVWFRVTHSINNEGTILKGVESVEEAIRKGIKSCIFLSSVNDHKGFTSKCKIAK